MKTERSSSCLFVCLSACSAGVLPAPAPAPQPLEPARTAAGAPRPARGRRLRAGQGPGRFTAPPPSPRRPRRSPLWAAAGRSPAPAPAPPPWRRLCRRRAGRGPGHGGSTASLPGPARPPGCVPPAAEDAPGRSVVACSRSPPRGAGVRVEATAPPLTPPRSLSPRAGKHRCSGSEGEVTKNTIGTEFHRSSTITFIQATRRPDLRQPGTTQATVQVQRTGEDTARGRLARRQAATPGTWSELS